MKTNISLGIRYPSGIGYPSAGSFKVTKPYLERAEAFTDIEHLYSSVKAKHRPEQRNFKL